MPRNNSGVWMLSLSLLLSACAAQYQLTPEAVVLSKQMTDQQAEDILSDLLTPSAKGAGVCGTPVGTSIKLDGSKAEILSWSIHTDITSVQLIGKTADVMGDDTMVSKKVAIDFSQLTRARVLDGPDTGFCSAPHQKTYLIRLMFPNIGIVDDTSVDVNVADLDRFMAAVSHLSPGVRLHKGLGIQ